MKRPSAPSISPKTPTPADLVVIDRLEVGPVTLAPNQIDCPYVVKQGSQETVLTLSYRYEEPVFTSAAAGCRNLASMITAQVALNYGLFCKDIVFIGTFDKADRAFLSEMAENTAREILVKKLLEPNPFLTGDAARMPAVKQDTYLRARIQFQPDPRRVDPPDSEAFSWNSSPRGHAVLSSGGKDSLLSYGLLHELKHAPHALFVNESGRHWFTALNAYRKLKAQDPHTGRVWTNSDRVFNGMLRLMPFIRPDFQKLRSDEYPLRLWTVAVFLFGALPLMRKRGLGRLIIGDEYDTTVRTHHSGIPHYDGLYDQSIYFDRAMSRYFARKQWGVAQFSLLRPMSEMLIEKVLLERYPNLLELQTSCHATHVDGERVRPCGACEKCRRIVGMLTALGGDPALLGYSAGQIEAGLRALSRKGVHQETPGAEHLAYMLRSQGLLEDNGNLPSKAHPEVLKLRFHPDNSPLAAVPRDLRRPLVSMLLKHADGALTRNGRMWLEFDPLKSPEMDAPFAFEAPRGSSPGEFVLAEMNWPQAKKRLAAVDVALLPVGAIEQHGPHLPLDTDAFDAEYLCLRVADACSHPKPLVLPLISYGVSYHHDDFPGTVSIAPETLSRMVHEIGMSMARQGITKLIIVNGHGGNGPALHFAAQLINRDAHIFTCVDTGESSDRDIEKLTETANDVHAGEIETSTTLAVRPELVDMTKAKRLVPQFSNRYLDFTTHRSVTWYVRTKRISESGVMGDPTKASAAKGEQIWEVSINNLVELVESIKGLPLQEIHQRRY